MSTTIRPPPVRTVAVGCAAPPDAAWAVLADPRRWPQWAGGVRRVTITRGHDARPPMLASGQLLIVHGPRPVTLRVRIDRVDRGRRCDWTIHLGAAWRLHGVNAVEPEADGCRLVTGHRLDGPGAGLLRPAVGAATRWSRRSLHRLARLAEQRPQSAEHGVIGGGEHP